MERREERKKEKRMEMKKDRRRGGRNDLMQKVVCYHFKGSQCQKLDQ